MSNPSEGSNLRRFIQRAIDDRRELARNGGGTYDPNTDALLVATLDELDDLMASVNVLLTGPHPRRKPKDQGE